MSDAVETEAFLAFLHRECQNAVQPTVFLAICRKFLEETKSKTKPIELNHRARRILRDMNFEDLTAVEKLRRIFTLSAVVEVEFLAELRRDADVDVDGNGRITRYEAHDGSLLLQGSHSQTEKLGYAGRISTAKRDVADEVEEEQDPGPAPPAPKRQALQAGSVVAPPDDGGASRSQTQLIPTGMGAGSSNFGQVSLSPAGAQNSAQVAHPEQHVRVQENGPADNTKATMMAQGAGSGANCAPQENIQSQQAQSSRHTGKPVSTLTDGAQQSDRVAPKNLIAKASSSITNAPSDPNLVTSPRAVEAPATELATVQEQGVPITQSSRWLHQLQQTLAQQILELEGRRQMEDRRANSSGPMAQASEFAGCWNPGSQQAVGDQGYAPGAAGSIPFGSSSSYGAWLPQQLSSPANGAFMAQNFARAPAPDELKPSLAASEQVVTIAAQKRFRDMLLNIISGQNLSMDERLVKQIREATPKKSLNVADFTFAVDVLLRLLSKSEHAEEGIGFKKFLHLLDNAVAFMGTPALAPFRERIEELQDGSQEEWLIDAETLNLSIATMVKLIF